MIKHNFPHQLDDATAKKTVDCAFAWYKKQYPEYQPQLAWQSAQKAAVSFAAKGIQIKGVLTLAPQSVLMELDVPFVLRMFKGLALEKIEKEMTRWIAEAEAGRLPADTAVV